MSLMKMLKRDGSKTETCETLRIALTQSLNVSQFLLSVYKKLNNCLVTTNFPMDTSSSIHHRFDVEIPRGKFVEISSILKGEPRNNDIDSTWKFKRGFDFQNRRDIDEFSTWIFLWRFDVELAKLLYSLFPFYHFRTFSALGTYSKLIWYSAELMWFQKYWRNHWY